MYHYYHHHYHLNVFAIPTRCNCWPPLFSHPNARRLHNICLQIIFTQTSPSHIVQIAVTLLQLDLVCYDIPSPLHTYYAHNIPRLQISVCSPNHGISSYSCIIGKYVQTRNLQKSQALSNMTYL